MHDEARGEHHEGIESGDAADRQSDADPAPWHAGMAKFAHFLVAINATWFLLGTGMYYWHAFDSPWPVFVGFVGVLLVWFIRPLIWMLVTLRRESRQRGQVP